jgi:hypothetical protein
LTVPCAVVVDGKSPCTVVAGASSEVREVNANARYDVSGGEQGPGMQVTFGAMLRFSPENVSAPAQPLKSCSTVMLVTASPDEMVKAIARPCAVVPFHSPA